jgi:hypothetical protein
VYALAEVDPARASLTEFEMRRILDSLQYRDQVIEDWDNAPVMPRPDDHYPRCWGYTGVSLSAEWFRDVRLHLADGWVGVTLVLFAGTGEWSPGPTGEMVRFDADHWVVIAGAQERWEEVAAVPGAKRLTRYVRVICSSRRGRGDHWLEVDGFLRKHGGFRVWWIRAIPTPLVALKEAKAS